MARQTPNAFSEHVQRLEEERIRIAREMEEAEKVLRQKPKPSRPKAPTERKVRLNTVATIDLPRPKDHRFLGGSEPPARRPHRRPKSDARMAQLKFLILCLILAVLLLFFWGRLGG